MAGHNKWSKIKRKKGVNDAKRSKMFSKIIKEIQVSARLGGGDPEGNPRLRLAVQNAKGVNMPKENVERAIKKATDADASDYQEVTYEGYAPNGVAVFVECTTDNLNRTVSSVRSIFNKYGGNLSKNGSLDFIFDQKGIFTFTLPEGQDEEELMLEIIDSGAEDVEVDEGFMTVTTERDDFGKVQKKLEELGIETENAGLQRIPNTFKALESEDVKKCMKLIDTLEDDDDVQSVYHNIEMNDAFMAYYES